MADGWKGVSASAYGLIARHTRTSHKATPLLVRVQKRVLRGLEASARTGSGGILGSPGLVTSCLATAVGKYIPVQKT
jgi:hypothetical protein